MIRYLSEGGIIVNKKSLDDIYQSYVKDIYYYLLSLCGDKYIAEDIMQETFLRAYLCFEDCSFDGIKPWLFKVSYNSYIDYIRKNKKYCSQNIEIFNESIEYKTPEDLAIENDEIRKILHIVSKMPQKQKQSILLCDFNGLSYKEASQIMDVSLASIKISLYRARQHVREKIERK